MKEQNNKPNKGKTPDQFDPREDIMRSMHNCLHHAISVDEALEMFQNVMSKTAGLMPTPLYDFIKSQETQFQKERMDALDRMRILNDRLKAFDKDAKDDDAGNGEHLTIGKLTEYITKDIPFTQKEFLEFLVWATATLGELQGRIEALPDTVEWKKDALEKIEMTIGEPPEKEEK